MSLSQLPLPFDLSSQATFANYVPGMNVELVAMLKEMSAGAGLSCVYLHGDQSFGKSHLLQACCHEASGQSMYLPMKALIHEDPAIFEGLEHLQLICIDDIQMIANKTAWEEAFFHCFNRIRQTQTRLVVAANDVPRSIGIALPDLLSRLSWGAIYRIHPLNDEEKMELLRVRAAGKGLDFAPEVAQFLIKRSARDMDYLLRMMDVLDEASLIAKRRLTIPFVKEVLDV